MYTSDDVVRNEDEAVQQHEAARTIQRQWRVYQQRREDALEAQHNSMLHDGGGGGGAEQSGGSRSARGVRAGRGGTLRTRVAFGGAAADVSTSSSLLYDSTMSSTCGGARGAEVLLREYRRLYNEWQATRERNAGLQHILARHLAEQRHRKGEDVAVVSPPPQQQQQTPPLTATATRTRDGAGGDEGDDSAAAAAATSLAHGDGHAAGNNSSGSAAALATAAEQRYWAAVQQLYEAQQRLHAKQRELEHNIEQRRAALQHTIDAAAQSEQSLRDLIAHIAARATFVRSNHTTIAPDELRAFLDEDDALRCRIRDARVRHLQLQHHTSKLHRAARERDKRGDGMYLIDYEQLKIEKGSLQEKMEERNEDVVKLRGKVTTTIHLLTHVKEKLEHVRCENVQLREHVAATEGELAGVRDALAQTKRRRDGFVRANLRMREHMPLVGSEELLRDYEQRKAVIHDTRLRVVALTERHRRRMHCLRAQQPLIESLKHAISQYPT